MNLLISIRSELLKTKRSAAFWLSIFGALFIPVIFFLMYYFKPAVFIAQLQQDPWLAHFLKGWQSLSTFLLPMFIILVCSLVPQIEYKNNAWKQVFASPQSLANIFFSKFITIHLMILFCFLLFNIFMIVSAVTVNIFNHDYPFFNHTLNWKGLLKFSFKTYISILGISAIQYWLSLRFKNFIVPIAIGLALLITAMIIIQWEHIATIPYAHPLLTFLSILKKHRPLLENHELNSIGYFLVFTFLAFLDMKYRKERG
jgi:lantibiotic transport system permease protein